MIVEQIVPGARARHPGCVLAIGNMDGVHIGHQGLIEFARKRALAYGKRLGVLTFDPHPRRLFRPDDPPFLITPPDLKIDRLTRALVDVAFIAPFTRDFSALSARDFIDQVLTRTLETTDIVVGHDFRFGHGRTGDTALLRQVGLTVTEIGLMADATDTPYSSSRVRDAVAAGDMATARALLGWPFEIRGPVIRGDQRGRTLGYPTANLDLGEIARPAFGIYAADVQIADETHWRRAAINIGIRPMFGAPAPLLEAHILDFAGDLYGQTLRVRPLHYLRPEARFDTLDALTAQMAQDCVAARLWTEISM